LGQKLYRGMIFVLCGVFFCSGGWAQSSDAPVPLGDLARSLRKKKTYTIGILASEIGDAYSTPIIAGIENFLRQRNYFFLTGIHRHDSKLLENYSSLLLHRGVEGFITIDLNLPHSLPLSTVAVAGHRQDEVVQEDGAIDWARSDYDPYARTKKFCEHMVHQLLPDVPRTIFRPAIVLGDSRRPETTQFDMVQAFSVLASLPVLPLKPTDRIDIVPADYVGKAIVAIHQKNSSVYSRYHLSSGTASQTYRELTDALAQTGGSHPKYLPALGGTFVGTVNWLSHKKNNLGRGASLLKVFWPYLVWNTVFDNSRVVEELDGETPAKFSSYAQPLLKFSRANKFHYPAKPWPLQNATGHTARGVARS